MPLIVPVLLKRSLLSCLIATALTLPALAASGKQEGHYGRQFDARIALTMPAARSPSPEQTSALQSLRTSVPELRYEIDAVTGATRTLSNPVGTLTGPSSGDNKARALSFLQSHAALLGLTAADLAEYEITDDVQSNAAPIRNLYLRQKYQGLPVYNGQLQLPVDNEGRILIINNLFLPNLAQSVNRLQPIVTAEQALAAAAQHIDRTVGPITQTRRDGDVQHTTVMNADHLSKRPIEAKLMLLPIGAGDARLVWNFQIWERGGGRDIGDFTIDAETGQVWTKFSWIAEDQYKVFEVPRESPNHTTPLPPADGRTTQVNPASVLASAFGWHDTNGVAGAESTLTIGNNAQAYTDTDANDAPDPGSSPDCTAPLNCTFALDLTQAPSSYRPAAVANLFYMNNMMHDIAYPFGFNEAGGNFQVNNYGNGGSGNDSVQAEAQDGEGTNNANFGTPPDGSRPTMQMFVWTSPTPDRDGDFDNGIIAHEYGHGISNRLVGGPSNVSCLGNSQQAGEGLSDWWSLYYTQPDATSRMRSIGTYALNQATTGVGIRTDYYDGDPAVNAQPQENLWTYANVSGSAVPHGVGEKWAQAFWQVSWALIDKHGYDADLDNYTGTVADKGNIRAMYYSIQGLKNSICSPAFTDIRDGIIAAANAAPYNGADTCTIWRAFAEYGLGSNAVSGGANSTSPTNGFNIPDSCNFLGAETASQQICAGTDAVFPITVGEAWTAPATATLSATGNPAPSTTTFSTNPAPAPSTSTLTFGNTTTVAAGTYPINVHGTNGTQNFDLPLSLTVFAASPSTPALSAPANAAVDVAVSPSLTWSAATEAGSYVLEVATDNAFGTIVYTQTVTGTSHNVATPLQGSTEYFWRVRSTNPCGAGSNSPTFSFTTEAFFCAEPVPALAIPDGNPTGVTSDLVVANGGTITDLNVKIEATHSWVGDLIFTLTNVSTGTSVIVIDRPGQPGSTYGCNRHDINATLDDEAAGGAVETQCASAVPTINGTFTPNNLLAAFDGQERAGTWRLTVSDVASGDTGTLTRWCLSGSTQLGPADGVFEDSFE
ncbi:MAG TPA: M36 family metallopeptidase [Pseudomonadota bacterium]|nr:M36 family metallopeptidase [Xanthomonadales bacterium]HQW80329.1 M36 family metallopeptidase [Pseudomonadota bacterium]